MGGLMSTVTVSSKYQVVIPQKVRKDLGIKPGQKFEVVDFEGCLEFVPIKEMKSLRGTLAGLEPDVRRDKRDRL
jgi:AbrB family looped-hinge helix DNA binding protein